MRYPNSAHTLEKFIEVLSEDADPRDSLQQGLVFLIKKIGCQGGAIFIQADNQVESQFWFEENIPPTWHDLLSIKESAFSQAILEMTKSGCQVQPDPAFGLIGGIPLTHRDVIYGGMLFFNSDLGDLTLDNLESFAQFLTIWVRSNPLHFPHPDLKKMAFFDLLVATQDIFQGLQVVQQRMIEGIQEQIDPDRILLFLYHPEKSNLLERIEHDHESGRLQHRVVYLTRSLLDQCIADKKILFFPNLAACEAYNPEIDGQAEISMSAAIFIPMIVSGEVVGAVELVFREQPMISTYQRDMLAAIVTTFGFSTINNRQMQQLRIANADIEANRWELIHSRNTLRALFDSLPSSIYIIDKTYRIVAINMTRSRRAGLPPDNLVGNKCYEALFARRDICAGCLVNETLFSGPNTSRNSRVWDNDQLTEWEINTFVVLNDENQPGQAIVIEQDVTEKRRLEANLVQSEKLAAVGQLAAGVAHEISNPLAAIIANAQILERDLQGDAEKLESVELIEQAGVRASEVVKNLLGIARKEQYDLKKIHLNDTIQNAIKLVQHELLTHSISLREDLAKDLPMVMASRDQLQGVWVNMMMNALDAMEGQEGRLTISTRYAANEFRVTIADNGQGIPPERISRIFEPFYSTKHVNQGTGLGLSICHRVIKNHGGYISVDSQVGIGTRFTIVLPGNTRQS
jgi:two-component system NtrC family sensor kinase